MTYMLCANEAVVVKTNEGSTVSKCIPPMIYMLCANEAVVEVPTNSLFCSHAIKEGESSY